MKKTETVAEYLARGGKVKILPEVSRAPQASVIKTTTAGGPVTLMTLEEADLFYGEARKSTKPKREKSSLKIDLNALPAALRSKFIAKLKEEADGEGYEEDFEEEEDDEDEDSSTD